MDSDTRKLIEIATYFLERYFDLSREASDEAIGLYSLSETFDEDDVHHCGPYLIAAQVFYLYHLGNDPQGLDPWILDGQYHKSPPEAMAYYRSEYFRDNDSR